MSDEIIDLDALAPRKVVIKINGSEIYVDPPKTGDLIVLGNLSQAMYGLDTKSRMQADSLVQELTRHIHTMIPELANVPLGLSQLQGLVKVLSDASRPPETKELEKRGITPNDDGKNDPKDQPSS